MSVHDTIRGGRRRFRVVRLPRYLIVHMSRFQRNNFFTEKNPTIVNFPVKGLNVAEALNARPDGGGGGGAGAATRYNLLANVCHEGKPGHGYYHVHVNRRSEGLWYDIEDLSVTEVLPQQVVLSETYVQLYERSGGGGRDE